VRMPTFSRHSSTDTADDERPTVATGDTSPVRERTDVPPPPRHDRGTATVTGPKDDTMTRWADTNRADANRAEANRAAAVQAERDRVERTVEQPVVAGPKPRASLLATTGLICAVAAALLVLSGPLLGYGIGVAVLALILSLSGVHATGRRHVAGKTDALIGMVLSLAAIVVGVLALTGSLSWLGTDMQPVNSLRAWLDTQFVNRF
jgi:hypothetical protein